MRSSVTLFGTAILAVTQGCRTATLNAARDLYGAGSNPYNTVAAAWSAVSVS